MPAFAGMTGLFAAPSLQPDIRLADHLAPALTLRGDVRGELVRAAERQRGALREVALAHRLGSERILRLAVDPGDRPGRCARRCEHTEPRAALHLPEAGLDHGRNVAQDCE